MMTSSTGSISPIKASDAKLWCCAWTNGWVNNGDGGDLRRHRAHYDVTVLKRVNFNQEWINNFILYKMWGKVISIHPQWRSKFTPLFTAHVITYPGLDYSQSTLEKSVPDMNSIHDDVIKWKSFSCHWPFVRGIHRSPVNSPHKGHAVKRSFWCFLWYAPEQIV